MGRRSINTTKSGKYMNPTDQARKEARKKELKKNKKQRQIVRQAVLKGKDPAQLLDEMEKIDEMEYNVLQPSPLNEKVLKEKRKKLKETFDRVMRLYHTEDPELWSELKRKELEYEKKRNKRISYFESVRAAESIQIDDIPLPSAKEGLQPSLNALPRIQLPPPALIIPPIPQALVAMQQLKPPEEPPAQDDFDDEQLSKTPACPPGPPPNLEEMEDLDSDYDESLLPKNQKKKKLKEKEDDSNTGDEEVKAPSALQQKMLAISGQNIDDFMKEMENVQRKKEAERAEKAAVSDSDEKNDESENEEDDESHHSAESDAHDDDESENEAISEPKTAPKTIQMSKSAENPEPSIPLPPQAPPQMPQHMPQVPQMHPMPNPPHMMPPHAMPPGMFRPPPMRGGFSGHHHHHPGMRMPPRMGIRMPPAPPPGLPPKYANKGQANQQSKDPKSATIEAKPQIRNLSADVTRFVPSTLRSKKDDVTKKPRQNPMTSMPATQNAQNTTKAPTKDDAYMQFMKEMQGFL
ncbi:WW domain-binding protein 11 [Culicoides brevitarsis]|uniref:WW domain-binding protein 11 n=1 Tax=Culicoides brevitarsis TaxID=469753 RepID=UPI00307BDAFC